MLIPATPPSTCGKREAEADSEADPLLYTSAYGLPAATTYAAAAPLSTYAYAAARPAVTYTTAAVHAPVSYAHYGLPAVYRGKREAAAESYYPYTAGYGYAAHHAGAYAYARPYAYGARAFWG